MHMKHLGTTNNSSKHNTRDTHNERKTLVIENHAHMDMGQINRHNIDSITYGNTSHQ